MRVLTTAVALVALVTVGVVAAVDRPRPPTTPPAVANDRPLIGILTQACHHCPGKSYVAAAYVKWIESAGGRAVPVRFYVSDEELRRLFNTLNGLIFPGAWGEVGGVAGGRRQPV